MTCVLLVPGDAGGGFLAPLVEWSAADLLGRFVWWGPSATDPAPSVVQTIAKGSILDQPLSTALAADDKSDLSFLVVVTPEASDHDQEIRAEVSRRLDFAGEVAARTAATGDRLRCAGLFIPRTAHDTPPSWLVEEKGWPLIYVAPEDRAGPVRPNALPDHPEVYALHGAHALACIGALWDPAALTQTFDHDGKVSVARAHTSIVDFGHIPDHVAARVLRPRNGWPNPDPQKLDRVRGHGDIVEHLAAAYLTNNSDALGLSEFRPITATEKERVGFREALRRLVAILIGRVTGRPIRWIERRRDAVLAGIAQRIEDLAGPEGDFEVQWTGRGGTPASLEEAVGAFERRMQEIQDPPVARAWSELRVLSLGLVDGTDLPRIDAHPISRGGRRALIAEPTAIAPDLGPSAGAIHEGERYCDPLFQLRRLAPDAEAPGPQSVVGDDGSHPREGTLLWRVGAGLAGTLAEAERQADTPTPTPSGTSAEADHVRTPRRRRMRRRVPWVVAVLAVLGAATVVLTGGLAGLLVIPLILLVCGILLVTAVASTLWALLMPDGSPSGFAVELAEANARLLTAQRRRDAIRLQRRYEEFLDWAEIIGRFLHEPWVGGSPDRATEMRRDAAVPRPSALTLSVALATPRDIERLSAGATRRVFYRGWLNREYERAYRDFFGPGDDDAVADTAEDPESPRRRWVRAVREGVTRRLADGELPNLLLEHLGSLDPDDLCASTEPARDPGDTVPTVEPLGPSATWFDPSAELEALASRLSSSVVRLSVERASESLGGTGVIISDGRLIATARHVVDQADQIRVLIDESEVAVAVVARVAEWTDLALLSVESPLPAPAAPLAAPEESVRRGDPIITVGHPMLFEGEPSVAFGYVTATERRISPTSLREVLDSIAVFQADYRSAPGASGSPVVDTEGRLVGIATAGAIGAGDPWAERFSFAVPVGDLHRLLAENRTGGVDTTGSHARAHPSTAWAPGRDQTESPSALLGALSAGDDVSFDRRYWSTPDRAELAIARPAFDPPDGPMSVARLNGSLGFGEPLRIRLTRTDISAPCPPGQLTAFGHQTGSSPEPERLEAPSPEPSAGPFQ